MVHYRSPPIGEEIEFVKWSNRVTTCEDLSAGFARAAAELRERWAEGPVAPPPMMLIPPWLHTRIGALCRMWVCSPRSHPGAEVSVEVSADTGLLPLTCAECGAQKHFAVLAGSHDR